MNLDIAKFALNWEVFSVIIFSARSFQIHSTSHFSFLSRLIFKRLNSIFFYSTSVFIRGFFFYEPSKIFQKKCIFLITLVPKKERLSFKKRFFG